MVSTQPSEQAREHAIQVWMLKIAQDGGNARFDDLHIDHIDELWKPREMWIEGGVEAFRLALQVRDRCQVPFIVGLGFSLESDEQCADVDFQTGAEFMSRVDWSPPSLYLFERGKEPRIGTAVVRELNRSLFPGLPETVRCYYISFRETPTNEYRCSVFLEG